VIVFMIVFVLNYLLRYVTFIHSIWQDEVY